MIDYPTRYQFGFYAPDTHKEPDPEIIGRLLDAFKNKGFIPTTEQEFQIVTDPPARPTTRLQLQFTSPGQEWNLAFEPHRLLLKKENVPETEMGSARDFCKETEEVFRLLLDAIPFSGTRLSFASNGLLAEMSPQELVDANKRILNSIPFYARNCAHQWTTRNVARVDVSLGEKTETLNVITDINRVQGTIPRDGEPVPFDRIQIAFDINTYQEKNEQRFGVEDVGLFLKIALEKSERILEEIERKLNE